MPERGKPLRKLGFLTIGRFDETDPGPGHEQTLAMIERAEALGFDSVWLRHRHLQPGISSPVAMLAAASQRTSRIEMGTAVIPLSLENPLRLAEDLASVDILSGGRINPGTTSRSSPTLPRSSDLSSDRHGTSAEPQRRTCAHCEFFDHFSQ